jgi:YVTN family beta-propeller protein
MVLVDDRFLYVALEGDSKVTVVDTSTNAVRRTITVGQGPTRVTLTDDGDIIDVPGTPADGEVEDRRIHAGDTFDHTISVILLPLLDSVVHTFPPIEGITGIAESRRGKTVYVTENNSNTVMVIDTTTTTTIGSINIGAESPAHIAANTDGSRAYVANLSGSVSVIDTTTAFPSVSHIPVGNSDNFTGPFALALSPDGGHIYTTHPGNIFSPAIGTLSVIDTRTKHVATVTCGALPFFVAVSKDGNHAYISNAGDNTISVIDATAATPTVIDTISVANPGELLFSPDGSKLFVSNINPGTVTVISISS